MFGTVTSGMIADQLKTQFDISLDKKKIHLENPIRTLGEHEVELRLHPDVNSTLKVRVESTTPPPAPDADAADKKEDTRTEKRGKRTDAPENTDKKARAPRPDKAKK